MAIRYLGNLAVYEHNKCTWCTGTTAGILRSTSFASCVGLVLYGPTQKIGVVAHYSGSLGHDNRKRRVHDDTQEILRAVCPISPGIWDAWVFGGISLQKNFTGSLMTVVQTKSLIDTIRKELKENKYIPINLLRSRRTSPEMNDETYVPHGEVSLNLADGKVTWGDSGENEKSGTNPYI